VKIRMRPSPFLFFICLVLSFLLIGCPKKKVPQFEAPPPEEVQSEAPTEQPAPPAYFVHTVTLQGESLSIIAKWYTGDLRNWEILAQHNPTINPNRIFKGDKIQIPRDLLVREDAMTQEFVDDSQPHAKGKPASAKPAAKATKEQPAAEPVTPEGVPLFGPKDYSK
jgi:hypothetical protein